MPLTCADMMVQVDLLDKLQLNIRIEHGKREIWDIVRRKWVFLNPEEHVRQALLHHFIHTMKYPKGLIAVEKQVRYGSLSKRYDIVVYDNDRKPWLLAECKAPGVPVTDAALHQLLQYHSQLPCPYWVVSNGVVTYCADARNIHQVLWIGSFPVK